MKKPLSSFTFKTKIVLLVLCSCLALGARDNQQHPHYLHYGSCERPEFTGNVSVIIPTVASVDGATGFGTAFQTVAGKSPMENLA